MERIALAREYRVAEWLRDAYLELTKKMPLDLEDLRPAEPYSSTNSLDEKWEATSKDRETLARIFYLQTKVAASIITSNGSSSYCSKCSQNYGGLYLCLCKCRVLAMVDETFRGEMKGYPDYVEYPLPRKLPPVSISYLCPLKKNCIANSTNSTELPISLFSSNKKRKH